MQATAARRVERAIAAIGSIVMLGTAPAIAPSATSPAEVLARVTGADTALVSYAVPVHMDVHVHKVLTFHMSFDGTQYFKRPDKLALDSPKIPAPGKKLFAEIGTPLTWARQYDLRLAGETGDRAYRLEGVPKHPSDIAKMQVDVEADPAAPLHAVFTAHDGTVVDMRISEQSFGAYQLPKHADVNLAVSGYKIHAAIEYGAYTVNEAVADSVFGQVANAR